MGLELAAAAVAGAARPAPERRSPAGPSPASASSTCCWPSATSTRVSSRPGGGAERGGAGCGGRGEATRPQPTRSSRRPWAPARAGRGRARRSRRPTTSRSSSPCCAGRCPWPSSRRSPRRGPGPSGRACWRVVVLNPRAPRSLSLRLVGALHWRDLADVAASPPVPAAVRFRAESLLRDGLGDMRLGDRITLARLATPALLPLVPRGRRAQGERGRPRQPPAARGRPRRARCVATPSRPRSCSRPSASPRWATNYVVRLTLVLQPRTPLAIALQQISSLVPRDLRRVAGDETLRPLVRAAALGVLDRSGGA